MWELEQHSFLTAEHLHNTINVKLNGKAQLLGGNWEVSKAPYVDTDSHTGER